MAERRQQLEMHGRHEGAPLQFGHKGGHASIKGTIEGDLERPLAQSVQQSELQAELKLSDVKTVF